MNYTITKTRLCIYLLLTRVLNKIIEQNDTTFKFTDINQIKVGEFKGHRRISQMTDGS